jgi:hypothetical protein
MSAKVLKYSLDEVNNIIFQGFDYSLPEATLKIISELSLQVGSPDYVKTPVFQKRENLIKSEKDNTLFKKKKGRAVEITSDEDWNTIRNFKSIKIEEKTGIDIHIDNIRIYLNKLTDKNYSEISCKIIDVIDKLIEDNNDNADLLRISSIIFDIASTNRFYSKVYADLYSELSVKYEIMKSIFQENLDKFTELFDTIEYVDPGVNYDKFCQNNKSNEKRKALCCFYINLMINGMISKSTIMLITRNLLEKITIFINQEDKKNEVEEITENIALLYKKEMYKDNITDSYPLIDGNNINEIIYKISNSKIKDYKSLTNKSLFKFMDMIDM